MMHASSVVVAALSLGSAVAAPLLVAASRQLLRIAVRCRLSPAAVRCRAASRYRAAARNSSAHVALLFCPTVFV